MFSCVVRYEAMWEWAVQREASRGGMEQNFAAPYWQKWALVDIGYLDDVFVNHEYYNMPK